MAKARSSSSAEGLLPSNVVANLVGHDGPVHSIICAGNGKYCFTAGHDRTVRLWNPTRIDPAYTSSKLDQGSIQHQNKTPAPSSKSGVNPLELVPVPHALPIQTYHEGHSHPVHAIAVDPTITSSPSCIVSTSNKTVVVTDLVTQRVLRRLHGHLGRIDCVSCTLGAECYLSGGDDAMVRIWDGRSRNAQPIFVLGEAKDSITSIVVHQRGHDSGDNDQSSSVDATAEIITASVDGFVRTYDLRTGLLKSDDASEPVTSLSLSSDGVALAASCLDGTIHLIDRSRNANVLGSYSGGHVAGKYSLQCNLTHDGQYIATGSEDGNVVMYDVETKRVARNLRAHTRPTCSVACYPSTNATMTNMSSVVLSAGYDGKALVWADPKDVEQWDRE